MARNHWVHTTSVEIAGAVASFKTILQQVAPAGIIEVLQQVAISFDGIVNTGEPVQWQLIRQTTAGTGGVARAPLKTKDTSTVLQLSGQEGPAGAWGVEPTATDIMAFGHVHPQAGLWITLPLPDGEVEIAGGGRLGFRINVPAAVNCLCTINGEE